MFGLFKSNPSKDQFAKMLLGEAAKQGVTYEYDPKEFVLKNDKGRILLGNWHDHYCQANAEHKKKLISNFVATLQPPKEPSSLDEVGNNLITAVRERAMFAFTDLEGQASGRTKPLDVASIPLTKWFASTLVIDSPHTVAIVTGEQLKKWGVSIEEAAETGVNNLRNSTVPKFVQQEGYFRGTWDDDYDSSRILLPELFAGLPLDGDPVIVIPNRLTLMVTGSRQTDALKAMLAKAEEIVSTIARPQNPAPLVIKNGVIEDFTVPESSSVFHEVRRATCLAPLMYYNEQKELLEKLHEKTGKDIFVAKYTLNQRKDGSYFSYSIWSRNIVTLLPSTDMVALHDSDKPENEQMLGMAPLEKVLSIAGDLMLDAGMFPTRYYVSKFPDAEMLKKILG